MGTETIESFQLFPFTLLVLTTVNMLGYIHILYRPPGLIPTQMFIFQHFWAENNFLMVEVDKSFIIAPEKPVRVITLACLVTYRPHCTIDKSSKTSPQSRAALRLRNSPLWIFCKTNPSYSFLHPPLEEAPFPSK